MFTGSPLRKSACVSWAPSTYDPLAIADGVSRELRYREAHSTSAPGQVVGEAELTALAVTYRVSVMCDAVGVDMDIDPVAVDEGSDDEMVSDSLAVSDG
jgi:hypothetical protein